MIQVNDFHKSFANHVAARGITFRVESGELLAIIGPNGAGKTTTMRALAGIGGIFSASAVAWRR